MPSRNIDWEGYRGMTRLLLLAVVLALVLWWAVAISRPRRRVSKPVPRTPGPRPGKRVNLRFDAKNSARGDVIVIENNQLTEASIDADEDYWPDILDA